jgi:hypothetical protein
MVCNAEPVVVSHVVQCLSSGCELWCVMVSQYLLMMLCSYEPVVVNHALSWCAKVVNYGVLY